MRTTVLDDGLQDARYAVRSLARTPTFTATAILSLALGIGATATVFSVTDALLLGPLPVTRPERLVTPEQMFTDGVREYNFSHSDFERFRELTGSGVFAGVAATSWADAYDGASGPATERRAETLRVSLVTGDYFRVLGIGPRAGRGLTGEDDRESAPAVAVIGDSYWTRRFERSPDVIGRTIQLNGSVFTVIGIAPRAFTGDWVGWPTDVWVPSASAPAVFPSADGDVRTRIQYKVIARLADGVALPQARAAAEILYRDLQQAPPSRSGVNRNARLELVSAERGYSPQRESLTQALSILALSAVPGVQAAATSVEGLLGATPGGGPLVTIEGSDEPGVRIQRTMTVAPGFFRTVGQALLEGRDFRPDDREGAPPVVIVSESYARRAFGGVEVAGQRVRLTGADRPMEIVGVVADARPAGPRASPGPMFYYPPGQNLQRLSRAMCIVVRSTVPPASLASVLRRELRDIEASLPVLRIDTIEEQLSSLLFQERLITRLAAFFATLALLLTALGLYAVLAFATERRRREIGIRLALGASPATVMGAVVRDGTILVLAGLLLGIPTGVAILRLVSSRLFGVGVADPVTIVIAAVVLIGIAELAVFAPAQRAARIDPAMALRME